MGDVVPMSDYYRQSYVLSPVHNAKAIRYVCYEDLRSGKFCVSSGEVLTFPQKAEELMFHAVNQAEHFIQEGVGRWFDSLLEAVEDYEIVTADLRDS